MHKTLQQILFFLCTLVIFVSTTATAFAREVYLLSEERIETLLNSEPVPFREIFNAHMTDTILWGIGIGFLLISVFLISISATLEKRYDGSLVRLKKYAPFIARVTIGLSFLSCAYHQALFGPELPFEKIFGSSAVLAQVVFAMLGTFMLFGLFSRVAGLLGLSIFMYAAWQQGGYMLTYINYFAELLVLILVGGHKFAAAEEHHHWWQVADILNEIANKYGELSFLVLRVGFGVSLILSALYAKIWHNQLALAVVYDYNLVEVFGMSAEFIVFGAAIIEILLGTLIALGIEIRFNALVIASFLAASVWYFGEAVWSHIFLIGIPLSLFCYGYDRYSLEGYFFKQGNREPIF